MLTKGFGQRWEGLWRMWPILHLDFGGFGKVHEPVGLWMGVLTDMKAGGVEDIVITDTEKINGNIRNYTKKTFLPNRCFGEKICIFDIEGSYKKWTMPIRNWGIALDRS